MGLFGRGKDNKVGRVCVECGRTLLAGEWTQRSIGDDGEELLICSLCSPEDARDLDGPMTISTGSSGAARASRATRTRDARGDSDAFWKALKDKDALIEDLESRIAQGEAERQELKARLAQFQRQFNGEVPYDVTLTPDVPAGVVPDPSNDVPPSEAAPGVAAEASFWTGEPAAEPPALTGESSPYDVLGEPASEASEAHPYRVLEPEVLDKDDLGATTSGGDQAFIDELVDDPSDTMPGTPLSTGEASSADDPDLASADDTDFALTDADIDPNAADTADFTPVGSADDRDLAFEAPAFTPSTAPIMQAGVFAPAESGGSESPDLAPPSASAIPGGSSELEGDAASLTILQRGLDLLNVSPVPKKIAETSEHLGIPSVHVGFDGDALTVTFMWTMGWYRYEVDTQEAATVRLSDRGYEERLDLTPNAGVRANGTVQLTSARIVNTPAQHEAMSAIRSGVAPATQTTSPADPDYGEPAPSVNRGDVISKSLAGNRTDDEDAVGTWEQQARGFKWDR